MPPAKRSSSNAPPVIDVYARISFEDEHARRRKRFSSPDVQADELVLEVERRGGALGAIFKDASLSAWNEKIVREDWHAAMKRAENGDSDGIIVWDVTRFTRQQEEGERLVRLAKHGFRVWSLYGEYDLTTADGLKHFRNAVTDAAHESNKISERTKLGKQRKAERGRSNATWRAFGEPGYLPKPEGWEDGDLRERVPDERVQSERDLLREVVRRLLEGETLDAMTRLMRERGFTTVVGNAWTRQALRQTLRRPSIAGYNVYDGQIVGKLAGEPVLDVETWNRLTALFDSRKRGRPISGVYLLSGLVRCGRCGVSMMGRPLVGRSYPDGEVCRQYWCRKASNGVGCGRMTVEQRWMDSVVESGVLDRLSDPQHADRIARRLTATRSERSKIAGEIERLDADADALASKVASWGVDRVDKAMQPITERLVSLRRRLLEIDGPETRGEAVTDTIEDWERGDVMLRRAMVRRAFPTLTLRPATSRGPASLTLDRLDWEGESLPA